MANKKTQKDFFNEIIEVVRQVGRDDLAEFCEDRIEKLSRKSSGSSKPTKTQIENEGIMDTIVEVLVELDTPTTATAIATDPRVNISGQKVSALLKKLVAEGRVIRTEEKGRPYFSVPSEV
jgi:predicted transcriptional regulator